MIGTPHPSPLLSPRKFQAIQELRVRTGVKDQILEHKTLLGLCSPEAARGARPGPDVDGGGDVTQPGVDGHTARDHVSKRHTCPHRQIIPAGPSRHLRKPRGHGVTGRLGPLSTVAHWPLQTLRGPLARACTTFLNRHDCVPSRLIHKFFWYDSCFCQ